MTRRLEENSTIHVTSKCLFLLLSIESARISFHGTVRWYIAAGTNVQKRGVSLDFCYYLSRHQFFVEWEQWSAWDLSPSRLLNGISGHRCSSLEWLILPLKITSWKPRAEVQKRQRLGFTLVAVVGRDERSQELAVASALWSQEPRVHLKTWSLLLPFFHVLLESEIRQKLSASEWSWIFSPLRLRKRLGSSIVNAPQPPKHHRWFVEFLGFRPDISGWLFWCSQSRLAYQPERCVWSEGAGPNDAFKALVPTFHPLSVSSHMVVPHRSAPYKSCCFPDTPMLWLPLSFLSLSLHVDVLTH